MNKKLKAHELKHADYSKITTGSARVPNHYEVPNNYDTRGCYIRDTIYYVLQHNKIRMVSKVVSGQSASANTEW